MTNYRKLTNDEVLELANRIKFEDRLDLDMIRKGVVELFGPTSHKAMIGGWNAEYNDENYDLRPSEIKVWDSAGKRVKRLKTVVNDWDDELTDFFCDIEIPDTREDESMSDVTVFINETVGLELPALFIKETS